MPGAGAEPRLVLVGGGHSHALVLRRWVERRPRAGVTLVSDVDRAPYSGMLPAMVAGHCTPDEMHIDLPRLCAAARVEFVRAGACGIHPAARRLRLDDGRELGYDWLSLNVGATPRLQAAGAAEHALAVKPIATFTQRWQALLDRARHAGRALVIAVVGGGAAGVELALALHWRLANERREPPRVTIVGAEPQPLPAFPAAVQRRFARLLRSRGIAFVGGAPVQRVEPGGLWTADGRRFDADETVWATDARGAAWLADSGLALDGDGFVRVGSDLRSVGDARVFAAGDVASVDGQRQPKSGVVAVRQAPVLAHNLEQALAGGTLRDWRPQRHWLALIGTGDRRAVATRGGFSAAGRWVWWWKQALDRRFMRRFADLG